MATLRIQIKLAALNKKNCEELPKRYLAQNSAVSRSQEDYNNQVSDEIEGRVTKKLFQEFSRKENRILGALSRLDDFLMNPLIQGHSGTAPETCRNAYGTNQGTNEDDSQSDIHPEAGIFCSQTIQNSSPEEGHDKVTGVHEEVTYCSLSRSSGKQKKSRSNSQPLFGSKNTPATIEADQILLALQQLANNNNSANFNKINNRISKLPKSLTTTMPTFEGNSENFELFEYFFRTSIKVLIQLTEGNRINYLLCFKKGDSLQTIKNTNGSTRDNLGEIQAVFCRKYLKPQSMASAKHKFQKIVFNPANQKLVDFLDEMEYLAKDAFGTVANAIIGQYIHAKFPPPRKKSIKQAHLENGMYEQIVTHLAKEFELNGLESIDELQMNIVSHYALNAKADRTKPTCHHCKKPGEYGNQYPLLNKK